MSAKKRNYKPTAVEAKAAKMSIRVRYKMRKHWNQGLVSKLYLEGFKAGIQCMLENLDFARFQRRRDRMFSKIDRILERAGK
jgi:hypothetical protein